MPASALIRFLSLVLLTFCFWGCREQVAQEQPGADAPPPAAANPLFKLLPAEQTGVTFTNALKENPYGNILTYQYFYNGGGVAVGDLNNDGLPDLYFTGNMTANRLYLNQGNLQFKDITEAAGVAGRINHWTTGVTMADVNGDGLLDIYVCYSGNMPPEARTNQLFINQGPDASGNPRFADEAPAYGLADPAFSTSAVFFDYDRDQDLDLFLLNHNPQVFRNLDDVTIAEIKKNTEPDMRVKLYRNDQGKFTDVTDKAGFAGSAFTYGLGAGVADVNNDGWPDIYVSNDYSAPDYLYLNNGNGTFTDKLSQSIGHTPLYSMGNDIADINNDGFLDIMTLDMLPEDNRRQKLLFAPDNYEYTSMFVRAGFNHQYMRNMLQVNNGDGTFSEVGQLAGVSNTDWSWAPLLADYDNDGWKDLFVTNGFLRDFTNLDFIKYRSSFFQRRGGQMDPNSVLELVNKIPSSNVKNYLYKNNGDGTFANHSAAWGISQASNSNGAAYADLDNDGALDLIVNNINEPAFIYHNQAARQGKHHYLQVKLEGAGQNTAGVGAKVMLYAKGQLQVQEQMPGRGFQSSVSPVLHFGLGAAGQLDSVRVVWPSGQQQVLRAVAPNQLLTLQEKNATGPYRYPKPVRPLLQEAKAPFAFAHLPKSTNDFKRQPLLVNPLSFPGPCMVKADVNGDGLEDVFVGGARGQAGALFLQQANGSFAKKAIPALEADKMSEDTDALFFDANQDGKLDLFIASGGYDDFVPDDALLQDRLYVNDGRGNFTRSPDALPPMHTSTSCVRATDLNGDGHPDLFVGGRVIPGRYPESPRSYLLLNDGTGRFTDQTQAVAPQLAHIGLVTDALWLDLNADGTQELVVVGEWMPVTVFTNKAGKLTDATDTYFSSRYSGLWNKLMAGDLNGDGRMDLVVGNLGLNTQVKAAAAQPAQMVYKDFDGNGSLDAILTFAIQGVDYPYVTRDELLDQISMMRPRFNSYESYADATLTDIFTPEELNGAGRLSSNYLQTAYFEQGTDGKFKDKALPVQAQYAPVCAIGMFDYNQDGHLDLILGGNISQARLRFGKTDANYGTLLLGNGKGEFRFVPQHQSGLRVRGDVRSVLQVGQTLLFGVNGQEVKAYKRTKT